jgi:hypothetical protein
MHVPTALEISTYNLLYKQEEMKTLRLGIILYVRVCSFFENFGGISVTHENNSHFYMTNTSCH